MAGQWYCNFNGQLAGPYTVEQLRQFAAHRQLAPNTPVSQTPQGPWVYASQVAGVFASAAAPVAAPLAAPVQPAMPQAARAIPQVAPAAMRPAVAFPQAAPVAPAPTLPQALPVARAAVPTAHPAMPQVAAAAMAPGPMAAPAVRPAVAAAPARTVPPPPKTPPAAPRKASPVVSRSAPGGGVLADRAGRRSGAKGGQYAIIAVAAVGLLLGAVLIFFLATRNGGNGGVATVEPDGPAAAGELDGPDDPAGDSVAEDSSAADGPLTGEQQKAIVQSIRQWKDVTAYRAITLRDVVRVSITDAWISRSVTGDSRDTAWRADGRFETAGRPVDGPTQPAVFVAGAESPDDDEGEDASADATAEEPATEAAEGSEQPASEGAKAEGESEPEPAGEAADVPSTVPSGPRYVFIKVSVTCNKPAESLAYSGWNGNGDDPGQTAAILADEAGNICDLVPYEKNPDAKRVRTANIDPGKELIDLLVFHAPPGSFKTLRLVLPKAGIGLESPNPYFAMEIPRAYLNRSPANDLAKKPKVRGGVKVRGSETGDQDEVGIGAIERGIEEGMREAESKDGSAEGNAGQFEVPAGDVAESDDGDSTDGDSPFPTTGSVGGGAVNPTPHEDVPEDIQKLIREEGGGNPEEEAKPFETDRIK